MQLIQIGEQQTATPDDQQICLPLAEREAQMIREARERVINRLEPIAILRHSPFPPMDRAGESRQQALKAPSLFPPPVCSHVDAEFVRRRYLTRPPESPYANSSSIFFASLSSLAILKLRI
jgi:hypothetical protein